MMPEKTLYHFPTNHLLPDFKESQVQAGHFSVSKRKWQTTIFDLATLATKHKLHIKYQAMDLFLSHCNLEICISSAATIEDAKRHFRALQVALYVMGISPFRSPFITTHSINEYSGINSRDSGVNLDEMPEELRNGIKSGEHLVEAWPFELSFECRTINEMRAINSDTFHKAAKFAEEWLSLTGRNSSLLALESAMTDAPKLSSRAQSILHIWTALESIFPRVTTEVSFRVALYMAQLNSNSGGRRDYHKRVKRGYDLRSKIAHGANSNPSTADWLEAWSLLTDSVKAIVKRGGLPSEDALLEELLA